MMSRQRLATALVAAAASLGSAAATLSLALARRFRELVSREEVSVMRSAIALVLIAGLVGCGHMSSPGFRCQANDEQDYKCAGKGAAAVSAENVSGTFSVTEGEVTHTLNFSSAARVDMLFGGASKAMMTSLRSNGTEAVSLKALDLAGKFVDAQQQSGGIPDSSTATAPADRIAAGGAPELP